MNNLLVLIVSLVFNIDSEEPLPGIRNDDLPGIIIESGNIFQGPALWGYINGGADLYFEYGFDRIRAQKLVYRNMHYAVDIYQMSNPEAAFGIFSISHYQCQDRLDLYSCHSPYQLQLVKDRYYVSIVNETGSQEEQNTSDKLARVLIKQVGPEDYALPDIFYSEFLYPFIHESKLIKGRLGIENGFPSWSIYFDGMEEFTIKMIPFSSDNFEGHVALICLKEASDFDLFLERNKILKYLDSPLYYSDNHKKGIKVISDDQFLYVEIMEGTIFAEEVLQWLE